MFITLTSLFLVFAQEESPLKTMKELLLDLCREVELNGARSAEIELGRPTTAVNIVGHGTQLFCP